jgi:hypothetical protein
MKIYTTLSSDTQNLCFYDLNIKTEHTWTIDKGTNHWANICYREAGSLQSLYILYNTKVCSC